MRNRSQYKHAAIDRLRAGEQWLAAHGGEPMAWVRALLSDAAQELESESGALWCQWTTGRHGHVRMFVAGDFGPRELDSFIEMLKLSRSHMRDEEPAGNERDDAKPADP